MEVKEMNNREVLKEDVLTVKELAGSLKISINAAYNLVRSKTFFPAFRVGHAWRVNASQLEKWKEISSEQKLSGLL